MAIEKFLLFQYRRIVTRHSSPLLPFSRFLSTTPPESEPQPPPTTRPTRSDSTVQPVSYTPKPKEEQPPHSDDNASLMKSQQQPPAEPTAQDQGTPRTQSPSNWTQDDLRYMKHQVSPVSYRPVAPLPEDRSRVSEEGQEMAAETGRIQWNTRGRRRGLTITAEEEKETLPFPMLIKPEKKTEKRVALDLMEAIKQVKANATARFDETVEAHVRLGIDQKRSELIVRGNMALPHGAKKEVRVAFFAEGAEADEARTAGADVVGGAELIEEIASSGKIDFDRCFATRGIMTRLYKISRILNQHGLMPNPKQGTVTKDVTKAVKEAKQGQVKFRMDKTSIVHVGLGKVSLTEDRLRDNVGAFMNALLQAKPSGLKKTSKYAGYVNCFHICSTERFVGLDISDYTSAKSANFCAGGVDPLRSLGNSGEIIDDRRD